MLRATEMPPVMNEWIRDTASHHTGVRLTGARRALLTVFSLGQAGVHLPVDEAGVRVREQSVHCRRLA
jgi:hypothetical protein